MAEKIQPSFAKGELSPALHGRVDTAAYTVGLAQARNAVVHTFGGVSNRHGTKYIGPVKDHTSAPRLIEFQFKTDDTYVLEFGHEYMRVIRNDGHVLDTSTEVSITGATQADPVVVTASGHTFSDGDEIFISGVAGMLELNGRHFIVANSTASTFELTDQVDGADIDGTSFTAYTSGGSATKIFEISTPYQASDLDVLKYTQSADVMTLVHRDYAPQELSRLDHDDWTLEDIQIGPSIGFPTGITLTINTSGSTDVKYKVTAVSEDGEEGLAGTQHSTSTITNITKADPAVVTISSSISTSLFDGEEVLIDSVVGMTEINGVRAILNHVSGGTQWELLGVDSTDFTSYSSAGTMFLTQEASGSSASSFDNTLTWNTVSGADSYSIYRLSGGAYSFIGQTKALSFTDNNIGADTSETVPTSRNPFEDTDEYPGAVGYYEQRRVFGGSSAEPDTLEFSQIGLHSNFNKSIPLRADDAITATLSSPQVNEIRHIVGLNDMLTLTSGSEWKINSGPDQSFAPDTIQLKPQSYWGVAHPRPLLFGNVVLYIGDNDADVRSLGYSLEIDGYTGSNINILAQHLTNGFTILDWCNVHHPENRVYMVRSDGKALTMSFDPEQEVIAWTPWDTDGWFNQVTSLHGGGTFGEDSVYFVVHRKVDGKDVRYIEVYRQIDIDKDVRDCYYVDCGLSYDSPVTITDVTSADPVVVTAENHGFSDGDEVDIFDIVWESDMDDFGNTTQPDQLNTRRYTVANATTDTFELTDSDGNDIDGTGFNDYINDGTVRKAVSTLLGLSHLEGKTVKVLADGNVISNLTVSSGSITLPRKFSRIHVGLQHIADVELLDMEVPQGTIQGYLKKISKVVVRFFRSRGMFVGPDKDNLVEMKQRELEKMGDPTDLLTGDKEIYLDSQWNTHGRVFMRQVEPLPMTILAVIPSFDVGAQE